jgi:hypothetical protein
MVALVNPPTAAAIARLKKEMGGTAYAPAPARGGLMLWVDHGGGCGSDAADIQQADDWSARPAAARR